MTNAPSRLLPWLGSSAIALSIALAAGPTHSATYTLLQAAIQDTDGAAQRLEAADRLRTLTQEVASAACHRYNGIAPEESARLMVLAKTEIMELLDALEFGDPERGIIGKESASRTLRYLSQARAIWAEILPALQAMVDTADDSDAIAVIKSTNDRFFEISSALLAEISGEYANPFELTQLDAMLIEIAGRQSMLTQKMARHACEIWTGNRSPEKIAALEAARDQFHMGITALHDGLPELGITPAPTEEILLGLKNSIKNWDVIRSALAQVIDGTADQATKTDLYLDMNKKMFNMDKLVHLYTIHALNRR